VFLLLECDKKTYNIEVNYRYICLLVEGSHSGLVRPPAKRLPRVILGSWVRIPFPPPFLRIVNIIFMSRARNKKELLEFGEFEFKRLFQLINELSPKMRDEQYVFGNRTTKDIVAHLYAWHLLLLGWYEEGMKGKKPRIPAPGYTIKDIPALNEKLYQEYKSISWPDLKNKFVGTHRKIVAIISEYSDKELRTKKKYIWTGSTDMASYFASALSSHYVWAINHMRKHFKQA
jgi:hypothetical protein